MSNELVFDLKANVNDAVANLRRAEQSLQQTGVAAGKAAAAMPKLTQSVGNANTTLVNFGRVVQDAPFGLIGIANNIDPLLSSFSQLKQQTGSSAAAFRALGASLLGPAGIAIGVSAVTSALISFGPQIKNFITGTKEASQSQKDAAASIAGTYTQVLLLKTAFERSQGSLEERREVVSQLNRVSERYFGNLNAEKTTIEELKIAYDAYINNLLRSFAVKQLESDLEPLIQRLAAAQSTINRLGPDIKRLGLENVDLRNLSEQQRQAFAASGLTKYNAAVNEARVLWDQINKLIENSTFLTANATGKQKQQTSALVTRAKQEKTAVDDLILSLGALQDAARRNELRTGGERPSGDGPDARALFTVPDTTRLQALADEFGKVNAQAVALQQTIENGINGAIDQFFNALANNQNPFEALIQGVKRLIAELVAAVVKAAILRAISTAAGDPSGRAVPALADLFGSGKLPGFATGGYVSSPTIATIAENGPEFVLRPDQLGAIMSMGQSMGGMIPAFALRGEDIWVSFNRVAGRRGRNF
ncbi:hypothetical protein UFOVP402_19 [uncultured Caudovirales phage]|uniref:Uncharacterized protein n=1 Tax=uncultured Caudovirales phage TaxID=2100421 RepID=A0A6J5M5B1_9CAUD|nr:hypothetical protein UFOVP402_19 [uncultured Caudovirales phage]